MADSQEPLVMEILEVMPVPAGTVVVGDIACDEIEAAIVRVVGPDYSRLVKIGGVEHFRKSGPGKRGERVAMLLVGERYREQIPGVTAGMKVHLVERLPPWPEPPADPHRRRSKQEIDAAAERMSWIGAGCCAVVLVVVVSVALVVSYLLN